VGSGGVAYPIQLTGVLKEWVEAPDVEPYRRINGRQIVVQVMKSLERYTPSEIALQDYIESYEGERFAESMAYVRAYPADLAELNGVLSGIRTPVLIIAGKRDPVVPLSNAEFLSARWPASKLATVDAGHFTWEDAADEFAALVTFWWEGGAVAAGRTLGED
jgi:pimeloyl-ACP methyl ester carboxylesterase